MLREKYFYERCSTGLHPPSCKFIDTVRHDAQMCHRTVEWRVIRSEAKKTGMKKKQRYTQTRNLNRTENGDHFNAIKPLR